jgi:hypothetical protein
LEANPAATVFGPSAHPQRERLLQWRSLRMPEVSRKTIPANDSQLTSVLNEAYARMASKDILYGLF